MTRDQFYYFAEQSEYTIVGGSKWRELELVVYTVPQIEDNRYYVTGDSLNWELGYVWLPKSKTVVKPAHLLDDEIYLIENLIARK